ncbi:helicase-related protein [Rhodococcus sp. IEGM 1341]|uniref:helicase-related protein n=1 Tax=Rhodococcus sp. IEGM 1341 TaxID=3047090 RepID=UPI0024B65108|nr:helicase-related protein [Rhodococcus sp. IEGM 1341]MDI9927395.1 helicase-related protein [Rhodococcus sp. IEGM 1341]
MTGATDLDEMYGFRSEMVEDLRRDLLGPAGGDEEVLEEAPLDRYVVGVLWPLDDALQDEPEPDSAEPDTVDGASDSPVAQSLMRYPSSMGLTFTVDSTLVHEVHFDISAAQYEPSEDLVEPDDSSPRRRGRTRPATWSRKLVRPDRVTHSLATKGAVKLRVAPGLELYVLTRNPRDGKVTVSAVARNVQTAEKNELKDARAWFQVELIVSTDVDAIVDRSMPNRLGAEDDLRSAQLIYRNARNFGIGHGCAVTWYGVSAAITNRIGTTLLPAQEVSRARPGQVGSDVDLRMSFLAGATTETLIGTLGKLVAAYREWISALETSLAAGETDVPESLTPTAAEHIENAREASTRIEAGIELLEQDPDVLRAFRLANSAMQAQRARQVWVRNGATGTAGDGEEQSWYPFQLAFILLNLPSVADRSHPERDVADLLWFPTGGGKTEAYLGLVAFVVLLRRIRDDAAIGVAVIMRYTLRLLTIQQFERATMLMCALEQIRTSDGKLGARPFSIGLWIGRGGTPNTLADAKKSLLALNSESEINEANPVQLTQCPWCGRALNDSHYKVVSSPSPKLVIACGNRACDFASGLPVYVVDQDIYEYRPELILGTVDKFAMMAWRAEVGKLFARDGVGSPPDLIIQDELHLISGPLGSMVGLYETAVDLACSTVDSSGNVSSRPKVIASTATIRRAKDQIKLVFDRESRQFPPPGIDPDQSFFAEPAPREVAGTRMYVGVMSPATSHATLLVRTYGALLQAARDIDGRPEVRDPYWTLLGYFNSLRVLGSALLQVEGDVRERVGVVSRRTGTEARRLQSAGELTSRVSSAEIPRRLKSLERTFQSGSAEDVVLATNMISVGVDIDRLGLMTVMGQPQSSSEYIQATSRVGRRFPGLVVTIFNSARSRDRSHFENFLPFHQALYRAVEATSATPFAARARDRGLHGVFVALARLMVDSMSGERGAHSAPSHEAELRRLIALIASRVESTTEGEETSDTVEQLEEMLKVWIAEARARDSMKYENRKDSSDTLLVEPSSALTNEDIEYTLAETPWPTLMSLRDVDAESALYSIRMRSQS